MVNLPAWPTPPKQVAGPRRLVTIKRPPANDDELWRLIDVLWDIRIPRIRVCQGHRAPFEALADAFFARYPVSVWKASRGFGGKSKTLACLGLTEAVLLKAGVTVLGGSSAQSLSVHEAMKDMWDAPVAPMGMLSRATTYRTTLTNGGYITALMASQKSVRGPHPQRLRLDEIDEMEYDILEASLGQPMSTTWLTSQVVMSSTHQYPDKTMSKMIARAHEKNWPVYEWCYRETMEPHGWLAVDAVSRKRQEVSRRMWETEYDLQEPSFEGRAFDTRAVERYFHLGELHMARFEGAEGKYVQLEAPVAGAEYVTGVDWAKRQDYTIIDTFRIDTDPWQRVAWARINRRPWPVMVKWVNLRLRDYPGVLVHDATGVGDVVADYLDTGSRVVPVVLTGRTRTEVFSDYVTAVEQGMFSSHMIDFAYNEHRFCSIDALFGTDHPPDSVVGAAMAWHGRPRHLIMSMPTSLEKPSYWRS